MTTLDDKLLGEKVHNYCSSSEGEGSDDEETHSGDEEGVGCKPEAAGSAEPAPVNSWNGTASNTGPKGVLEDWRKFKQLEAENRKEMELQRLALGKKLTLTVKTDREQTQANQEEAIEDELNELLDEEFLMKYQKQRVEELMSKLQKTPKFGQVFTLNNKDEFLNAIDKEDPQVSVFIHIYKDKSLACETVDGCLSVLATEYPTMKFCRILSEITGLSKHFSSEGVPAILVYKGGQVIGNFVSINNELGNDFFVHDLERFLIEFGMLPEK